MNRKTKLLILFFIFQYNISAEYLYFKKEPIINYINAQDNFYFYKIEIFALNEIHARKLEKNHSNIKPALSIRTSL